MVYMNEDRVRELIEDAVDLARNKSSPGNVSDEAVVQWIMEDRFIDGRWRSLHFLEKEVTHGTA
jgi:hypothetical protein